MARDFVAASAQHLILDATTSISDYPLSMVCWFRRDIVTTQVLFGIGNASSDTIYQALYLTSVVNIVSRNGGTARVASSTTGPTTGVWHHAAGYVASSTDRAAYIDGGSKGTNANVVTFGSHDRITVARYPANTLTQYFDGRIAEAGVWNVQLTDAEFLTLCRGVKPIHVRPQNLVLYLPLWGVHSPEIDLHPRSVDSGDYSLGLSGSPAAASHPPVIPRFRTSVFEAGAAPPAERRIFVVS